MKELFLLAGAAALGIAGPALAKPGHGNKHHNAYGYDAGCPHGLAKKNNGCMPPGQEKKLARGQHWQNSYGDRYSFGQIPYDLRNRYDLDPRDRYYYGNGYLYQVDPKTLLVQQVVSALLR